MRYKIYIKPKVSMFLDSAHLKLMLKKFNGVFTFSALI